MIRLFFESRKQRWDIPRLMILNDEQEKKLREYANKNLGKVLVVEIKELEEIMGEVK